MYVPTKYFPTNRSIITINNNDYKSPNVRLKRVSSAQAAHEHYHLESYSGTDVFKRVETESKTFVFYPSD